jgi:hypothetical protein
MGGVFGLRSFALSPTKHGVVTGPSYQSFAYYPGENHARCGGDGEPSDPSHISRHGCSCGFYAFYNGKNTYYRANTVAGIIMGYGRVVYGSEGFRCQKSKLVAMVNPYLRIADDADFPRTMQEYARAFSYPYPDVPQNRKERIGKFFNDHATAVFFATALVMLITVAVPVFGLSPWISAAAWFPLSISVFGVWQGGQWRRVRNHRSNHLMVQMQMSDEMRGYAGGGTNIQRDIYAKIAARYPDVKWYPNTSAMLKDFPLTPFGGLPMEGITAAEIHEGNGSFG